MILARVIVEDKFWKNIIPSTLHIYFIHLKEV